MGSTFKGFTVAIGLDAAIRQFGESCVQYADMDLGEVDAKLGYLEEFVRNQDAKSAAGESALFFDRGALEEIQAILDRAGGLAKADDPRLVAGRNRIAALKAADARLRAARAADTRMRPDVYAGGDAVTGAATVILAMGAGKQAAASIDEYIKSRG